METLLKELIVPITIVASVVGSVGVVTLIIVLRHTISGISLSRTGLQIHTNDVMVWGKLIDTIETIDTETRKFIRKATMGLMILDPETHGTTTEVMLVNREANLSLIYAAYENHHTRELSAEGAEVYIAHKAHDIVESIRIWKKHFPELTEETAYYHACLWIKKILIPNIRKSCHGKLSHYQSMYERNHMSKILSDEIARCIKKNLQYITDIDELGTRSDIYASILESGVISSASTILRKPLTLTQSKQDENCQHCLDYPAEPAADSRLYRQDS